MDSNKGEGGLLNLLQIQTLHHVLRLGNGWIHFRFKLSTMYWGWEIVRFKYPPPCLNPAQVCLAVLMPRAYEDLGLLFCMTLSTVLFSLAERLRPWRSTTRTSPRATFTATTWTVCAGSDASCSPRYSWFKTHNCAHGVSVQNSLEQGKFIYTERESALSPQQANWFSQTERRVWRFKLFMELSRFTLVFSRARTALCVGSRGLWLPAQRT